MSYQLTSTDPLYTNNVILLSGTDLTTTDDAVSTHELDLTTTGNVVAIVEHNITTTDMVVRIDFLELCRQIQYAVERYPNLFLGIQAQERVFFTDKAFRLYCRLGGDISQCVSLATNMAVEIKRLMEQGLREHVASPLNSTPPALWKL